VDLLVWPVMLQQYSWQTVKAAGKGVGKILSRGGESYFSTRSQNIFPGGGQKWQDFILPIRN